MEHKNTQQAERNNTQQMEHKNNDQLLSIITVRDEKIQILQDENRKLSSEIDSLEDKIDSLESEVLEKEECPYIVPKEHQNIRMESALEGLFNNLNYIPVSEIEKLVHNFGI